MFHILLLYQDTFLTNSFQVWKSHFCNTIFKDIACMMGFTYTVNIQKNIEDVITTIAENLKEIGFGVLETLDFKKTLSDKGLELKQLQGDGGMSPESCKAGTGNQSRLRTVAVMHYRSISKG